MSLSRETPESRTGRKSKVRDAAFRFFFAFVVLTVLLALGAGAFVLFRGGGFRANLFGFLFIFLGSSLGLMLGSLIFIRQKENKISNQRRNQ